MITKFPLLSIVLLAAAILSGAPSEPVNADKIATEAEISIERAGLRGDAAALAEAVKSLEAALAVTPDQPALVYTRGFASYVSSGLHRAPKDEAAREQGLKEAMSLLERVKGAPWEAEAAAIRGAICGELIALAKDPAEAGAKFGPESGRLLEQAAAVAPNSPRVLVFRGRSLLFTPQEYGGDPAGGTALIQQAVDRFAAPGAQPSGPAWGRADALTWLGIAKQRAGDLAAARAAWQQALTIEPNDAWVKFALLPSLDKSTPKR
jgi:tetratricopeptide (TPR) repeat protein